MPDRISSKSVLMITPRYLPDIGGVEKHVSKVVEHLVSRGYRTTVLTMSHNTRLPPHEIIGVTQLLRLPARQNAPSTLLNAFAWTILRLRMLSSYTIIHFHDVSSLLWGFPLALCRLRRNVFITFHGFERDPIPIIWKILRRIAMHLVEGSMCVGKFIQQIYRIVCNEFTVGATETAIELPQKRYGVIFVGRLERDTGILEHLKALEIIKTRHGIDLPLIICGSGRLSDVIISARARSSGLSVRMLGVVRDPAELMHQSSICLAAGYLSILEALSLGLPVIGVAVTPLKMSYLRSIRDIGAPISIQTTPEGVAREILRVLHDKSLQQSLATSGRRFASNHTWDQVTQQYISLWSRRSNPNLQ